MRRLLASLVSFIVLTTMSVAQAPSPAQYLLDEAINTISERYFGFAQIDDSALNRNANQELELACKVLMPCPYSVGEASGLCRQARVLDWHCGSKRYHQSGQNQNSVR